ARRLEPFGLGRQVGALVLKPPRPGAGGLAAAEAALAAALRGEAADGLVAVHEGLVGALVPGLAEDDLFGLSERVAERASRALAAPLRFGAGRAVAAGDARRSFHEARCALEALALAQPSTAASADDAADGTPARTTVATYRDLGSFQLLLSLQDDDA